MKQHTVQLQGPLFDNRINKYLKVNPGWKVAQAHTLQLQKTGGVETQLLVVFEASDESVGAFNSNVR